MIKEYDKASSYLRARFRAIFFEESTPSREESALFDLMASKLNRALSPKSSAGPKSRSKPRPLRGSEWLKKSRAKSSERAPFIHEALPLPPLLLIQWISQKESALSILSETEKKKLKDVILSQSCYMEEFFLTEGLHHPYYRKVFHLKASALSLPPPIGGRGGWKRNVFSWWSKMPFFGLLTVLLLKPLQASKSTYLFIHSTMLGGGKVAGLGALALGIGLGGLLIKETIQKEESAAAIENRAVLLQWKFKPHMTINMVRTADMDYVINGKKQKHYKEKNIVNFAVEKIETERAHFKGIFKSFVLSQRQAPLLKKIFKSSFSIAPHGEYAVGRGVVQPNERSIPSFPKSPVRPGDTWSSPVSYFFHDLNPPFMVYTNSTYVYLSNAVQGEKPLAVISYFHVLEKKIADLLGVTEKDRLASIQAKIKGVVFWDIKGGHPLVIHSEVRESHQRRDKQINRYEIKMKSLYDVSYPIATKTMHKLKRSMEKKFTAYQGVKTSTQKDGLHIELNEILFGYDSSSLSAQAETLLIELASFLEKYPHHEIVIEGHTDDRGSARYNEKLSLARAQSVFDFLNQSFLQPRQKIYLKAYGESKPLTSNQSEVGRKKNRRVEIILKQSGE